MNSTLTQIGNSKGVRISKPILEQCGLVDEIRLDVVDGGVLIRPLKKLREGWEESFKKMHANDDDILAALPSSEWDEKEWEWS